MLSTVLAFLPVNISYAYRVLVTSLWFPGFIVDLEFNSNADKYGDADAGLSPSLFLGQRLFARHFLRCDMPTHAIPAYLTPAQGRLLACHNLAAEMGFRGLQTVFLLIHTRMLAAVL